MRPVRADGTTIARSGVGARREGDGAGIGNGTSCRKGANEEEQQGQRGPAQE